MTNAGSSLNRTFGSMREILSDRSIVRNASNCEARKLGASHGQSGVIGSSVVLVPTFPGTYPHDAQPDYFRINNPAVIEWRLESKCRAATAVLDVMEESERGMQDSRQDMRQGFVSGISLSQQALQAGKRDCPGHMPGPPVDASCGVNGANAAVDYPLTAGGELHLRLRQGRS